MNKPMRVWRLYTEISITPLGWLYMRSIVLFFKTLYLLGIDIESDLDKISEIIVKRFIKIEHKKVEV